MKQLIFAFITIIGLFFLTSCKKESNEKSVNQPFNLVTKPLSIDKVHEIKNSIVLVSNPVNTTTGMMLNSSTLEAELEAIMQPAIENGRKIHFEMITYLQTTKEWSHFTQTEKNKIKTLSNFELAELSLALAVTPNHFDGTANAAIDWGRIRSCASGVFLGADIYYLLVENPKALLSARGISKILMQVGKRYVGYIGLILTAWDFYDCIS